jgi:hypothetical protein
VSEEELLSQAHVSMLPSIVLNRALGLSSHNSVRRVNLDALIAFVESRIMVNSFIILFDLLFRNNLDNRVL